MKITHNDRYIAFVYCYEYFEGDVCNNFVCSYDETTVVRRLSLKKEKEFTIPI